MRSKRVAWGIRLVLLAGVLVLAQFAPAHVVFSTVLIHVTGLFLALALVGWAARKRSPMEIVMLLLSSAAAGGLAVVAMSSDNGLDGGELALLVSSLALLLVPVLTRLRRNSS